MDPLFVTFTETSLYKAFLRTGNVSCKWQLV